MKLKGNWKKRIARLLVTMMIMTYVPMYDYSEAKAAGYEIANNGTGGITIDINAAPYNESWSYGDPYGPGGCTWFVGARVKQLTGKGRNATQTGSTWFNSYGGSLGFSTGQEVKAPAIVCWQGHVAILEKLDGNTAYLSEGGITGKYRNWGTWQSIQSNNGYCAIHAIEKDEIKTWCGTRSDFIGFVYLDGITSSPTVNNPIGCLDVVEGRTNAVFVRGWAFDSDAVSQALEIHVYIGGPAGSGEGHRISADQYRNDVNNVYGVGDYHGFDAEISTSLLGNQEVYVYAINIGSGGNLLMGVQNVTITNKEESEDVFQIEDGVLVGYTGEGGDVVIPEGVTSIGDRAFMSCSSLKSITLPESVTVIDDLAFFCCSNLASINIPESVTSIGREAFFCCSELVSITLPEGITSIENGTFEQCSSLASIKLPESVTSIGDRAFSRCSSLTSITLPESVTSIGHGAFSWCSNLKSISIPEHVTDIGNCAFESCGSLVSISMPDGVISIGNYTF